MTREEEVIENILLTIRRHVSPTLARLLTNRLGSMQELDLALTKLLKEGRVVKLTVYEIGE